MTRGQPRSFGELAPPELRRFARDTRPRSADVDRLRRRLLQRPPPPPVEPTRWLHRWLLGPALVATTLAFVLLRATPDAPPTRLAAAEPSDLIVSQDLSLDFEGQGQLGGSERAPRIAWSHGRLRASVTPQQGIDLRVTTQEAEVRVVGTVFTVHRDALGTRVTVERGKVEVRCVDGRRVFVLPGDIVWCEPGTAAGYLARARTLQRDGRSLASILAAVSAGSELRGPTSVQVELRWVRAEALRQHGRRAAALRVAAAALHAGAEHRQADFEALIAGH